MPPFKAPENTYWQPNVSDESLTIGEYTIPPNKSAFIPTPPNSKGYFNPKSEPITVTISESETLTIPEYQWLWISNK
jgi:hypothetical protein